MDSTPHTKRTSGGNSNAPALIYSVCSPFNFQSNELVIGSAGVKTRFLPEAELPECARLSSKTAQNQEGNLEEALKESARMSEERQMQQALNVS